MNCTGCSGSYRSDSDELLGHKLDFTMLSELWSKTNHCVYGRNITSDVIHSITHHHEASVYIGFQLSQKARLSNTFIFTWWTTWFSNPLGFPLLLAARTLGVRLVASHLHARTWTPCRAGILGTDPALTSSCFPLLFYSPFCFTFSFIFSCCLNLCKLP